MFKRFIGCLVYSYLREVFFYGESIYGSCVRISFYGSVFNGDVMNWFGFRFCFSIRWRGRY